MKKTKAEQIIRFVKRKPRRYQEIQRHAFALAHPDRPENFDKDYQDAWRTPDGYEVLSNREYAEAHGYRPIKLRALRGYYCDGITALVRAGWLQKRPDGLWEYTGQELRGPWYKPRIDYPEFLRRTQRHEAAAEYQELQDEIMEER